MKRIAYAAVVAVAALCLTSCEGCVKKIAKKATSITLSAAEGVAEALNEGGDAVAEKTTDALGTVVQGAGRSLDRQLGKDGIPVIKGNFFTLTVEAMEAVDRDMFDEIGFSYDHTQDGVNIELLGVFKSEPWAYFIFLIPSDDTYDVTISFMGDDNKESMKWVGEARIDASNKSRYAAMLFELTANDAARARTAGSVEVAIRKK